MSVHESNPNSAPARCPVDSSLSPSQYAKRWDLMESGHALCPRPADDPEDLALAGKMAWRNSARCVGRALWKTLGVVDARDVTTPDAVFEALLTHLKHSTNSGKIRSRMTVFPAWQPGQAEMRIWNHQLLRYAGYTMRNGTILGDPMNRELTDIALSLGWNPPQERGRFDLLPLIIQVGDELKCYALPEAEVLEVKIRHPEFTGIEEMGLKWYANPIISDMIFATGSAAYGCAPFNGHYMLTEIAARNFADEGRYNLLPDVAARIGLSASPANPLWKDRALLTLTEAVHWSFTEDGVSIMDHHRATQSFSKLCRHGQEQGEEIQAAWDWVVPPMSSSTTSVFHETFSYQPALPNFLLQSAPWETERGRALLMAKRVSC